MMHVPKPQTKAFLSPSDLEVWVVLGEVSQDLTLDVVELALDKQCPPLNVL